MDSPLEKGFKTSRCPETVERNVKHWRVECKIRFGPGWQKGFLNALFSPYRDDSFRGTIKPGDGLYGKQTLLGLKNRTASRFNLVPRFASHPAADRQLA
jgi:hypothetical protein